MYLFCKFGLLYIGFTLSFSPEAFWAAVVNMPDHSAYPQCRWPGHGSFSIFCGTTLAKTVARMRQEAAGAESRLTASSIAWNASMFYKYFLKVCKVFALCLHLNVFAIAPLQEELKCCVVSMKWTGCFAPATFLVQSRGWTRCPQVFSIFSFYDCGINVQIETSLPDVLLALIVFGDPNRTPSDAVT